MAETRAKARALRDAINVGVTAFEELGGEEEVVESSGAQERDGRQPRAQNEEGRGELPATKKQLNYLEALISDVVEDGIGRFEEMVGKPVGELTREEASEWIGRLSGRAA
jgi:archaellum component FlaC